MTQLGGHELYHYYEEQFPGLHDRVRQKITERYSEEDFREIAGKYAEKLGRLNGMAEDMDAESYEAMLRRIESEIFADAFGNINYFRLGADRYTDAARETVNETLGSETAAATERRTGPPTQFSEGETLQERIDRAIELLDNNTPASEVFQETGLIAMAGGQLQDGFGGEIVGRYSRGGNNEGRVVPSGPYDGTDGRKAGRGVEKGTEKTAGKLGAWETLDSGIQGRITKRITEQMKGATEEGQEFFDMFNSPEEFAQRFYGMLQQDRVAAEQWAHLIPNIDALMDELENIGAKGTSFSASEDEDIPESAAEYSRQRYREENREPQSSAEYAQMKERALEREKELQRLIKKGEATAEQRKEAEELRKKNAPPPAKKNKQQATIAKKDLRNTILSEFGIPDGRKAEIGKLIDAYADQAYKDGKLTETDRQALFDKLYSEGVMTVPADDAFRAAREIIKGGKVYVPESIKHEFGDDWGSFRREAFAEGILLTNNCEKQIVQQKPG